jgi:hypothetical protein
VSLLTNVDTWHSKLIRDIGYRHTHSHCNTARCPPRAAGFIVTARSTWGVRSHCRFRNRGTLSVSRSGIKWRGGGTKRQRDRALDPPRRDSERSPRVRSHCRIVLPLIQFIPDSLRESVSLFLKRQCDRNLRSPIAVSPRRRAAQPAGRRRRRSAAAHLSPPPETPGPLRIHNWAV